MLIGTGLILVSMNVLRGTDGLVYAAFAAFISVAALGVQFIISFVQLMMRRYSMAGALFSIAIGTLAVSFLIMEVTTDFKDFRH